MKKILLITTAVLLTVKLFSQGAAINSSGASADPSAGLDVQFSNKGFLLPRMTTAERNAIVNPADGLQIFNTTTKCFEAYISPVWQSTFCGCTAPSAPTASTHTPSQTQIVWNWNLVSGATEYKYNTINDNSSAIDNGTSTTFSQTGLTCNTPYTLYVWAYNTCGISSSSTLTQSTTACVFVCGTSTINFTYNNATVTYGTVTGASSTCWMNRNLGSSQVATAVNDALAYGDLFQWGRGDDGHQLRSNNATTTTLSTTDTPGHSLYITTTYPVTDWRSPKNDLLWQGASGVNNPCPTGWRVPTKTEIDNERLTWSSNNSPGAFANNLKWTCAGGHSYGSATIQYEGTYGNYWSSTVDGEYSYYIQFYDTNAFLTSIYRAMGRSVRCIKD